METKKTIRFMLVFLVISIFLSINLYAQEKSRNLNKLFSYYNLNGMFNGIVLAAENGKIIFKKAYGFADFERKTHLDTSSVFSIGSVTKPFTATAIMILNERGLLSYEDKLIKYYPNFPSYFEHITIRHLLTHTSGLYDFLGDLDLINKTPEVTNKIALDSLISQSNRQAYYTDYD